MNKRNLISMIFYLAGGRIRGATRLQKVVFLIERTLGIEVFRFEPWKYGPWSRELEDFLKEAEENGLIRVSTEEPDLASEFFGESSAKVYEASQELIESGRDAFEALRRADPLRAVYVKRLVAAALSVPLSYLIAYIYTKYPESTLRSTILNKVERWRRIYGLRTGG